MQYKDISLKLCHDSWTFNSRLSVRRRIFSLSLKIYPRASLPLSKQSVFKSLHLRLTGADGQIINKCCARLSETKKKHSQSIVFWLSLGCFGILPSITHLSVINYRPRTVNRMRNKWAYNLFWHCIICGEIQTAPSSEDATGPNYLSFDCCGGVAQDSPGVHATRTIHRDLNYYYACVEWAENEMD